MKKPFFVEISFSTIIMAEEKEIAEMLAQSEAIELIRNDSDGISVDCATEIKSIQKLYELGWDNMMDVIPYNSDDNLPLKDIIQDDEPFVDKFTVDMFK